MGVSVKITEEFKKRFEKLEKKYRHISDDLESIIQEISENPQSGDPIPFFSEKVWKIRMRSRDMKKGKSGGFRVLYFYHAGDPAAYLLDIYAKCEQENILPNNIINLLKRNGLY